jgi:threonine aldolase
MVALSKGLGCPAGSLLVGDRDAMAEARRLRKLLGGGMRQVGVLAATGHVALDAGFDHLAEDHARARRLAEGFGVDPATVDTNIVIAEVEDAPGKEAAFAERGIRLVAIAPDRIRLVTHRDVGDDDVEAALAAAAELL